MKPTFNFWFRFYIATLLIVIGWSIWTPAQDNTNGAPVVVVQTTNALTSVSTVAKSDPTSLSFGLDKVTALQTKVAGIPAWQYLATLLYVVLAFLVAKVIDIIVTSLLKKWTARTQTIFDDLLIKLLHGPIRLLAFIVLLQIGLQVFDWPAWIENYLRKGLYILLACSITFMVLRLVDVLLTYFANRNADKTDKQFNKLLFPILSKIFKGIILIIALLMTLDNLDVNVRSLIAGVSVGGLALGLAAQDTVGNLFGAVSVFVDKPFTVGDRIQLAGVDGVVEEIGLRSTRIRNLDGHLITIPNKTMGGSIITNIARRPNIKTVMNIGITYDTPVEKVQEAVQILEEVFRAHNMTHDVVVGFDKFADSALNINVVHWWKELDHKKYVAGIRDLNLEIKRRFDAAKINFAFPSQTVYLRQDNDWKVELPEKTA
jgi:MscS family membrane protein